MTRAGQGEDHGRTRPRLLFLAPGDVRKGRVEPLMWMQTCNAFAGRGIGVRLIAPGIAFTDRIPLDELWRHYALQPTFDVRILPTPFRGPGVPKWPFRLWMSSAQLATAFAFAARQLVNPSKTIVYSRLPVLLAPWAAVRSLLPPSRRPRLVYETHSPPPRAAAPLVRHVDVIVVNSEKLRDHIGRTFRIAPSRIVHAPLACHVPVRRASKSEARAKLGLPADATIACHAGKMIETQVEMLLQVTLRLQSRIPGFRMLFVGGNPTILEWTQRRAQELDIERSVELAGFVAPSDVGTYLAAADVLLLHIARSVKTFDYTTPGKSYDYMAAARPIVATDIPLFTEVFGDDGERAIRVQDHDPDAFAEGIVRVLSLDDAGEAMGQRGAAYVAGLTWEGRAGAVLDALEL